MSERLGTQLQPGGLEQSIHTGLLGKGLFAGASLDLYFAVTKNIGPLVTFTRASSGTFVGSDGVLRTAVTNLQRHSEDFTQGLTPTNATLTANQGTAPNGTLTADQYLETNVNGLHSQEIVDHIFIAGVVYTFSCYAKSIGGRNFGPGFSTLFGSARFGFFNLSGSGSVVSADAGVTASIQSVGDGWYRCSITSTCATGGGARVGVFIASGTSISYAGDITKGFLLWGAQLEQSSTVGEYIPTTSTINSAPRFDHTITSSVTNLLLRSEEFNDASWTRSGTTLPTLTANAGVAPDGAITADLWTRSITGSNFISQAIAKTASAIQYAFSVFVKQSVGNFCALRVQGTYPSRADVVFNISNGTTSSAATVFGSFTGASASITPYPNGWYRLTVTATSDTTTVYQVIASFSSNGVVVDGTDSVSTSAGFLWGAQLEQSSTVGRYVPTTTVSVTDNATESLGLLVEEARTNSIRNNTMVGAVAGTPGTLPTNYSTSGFSGLTREIIGTGTANGVSYIDIKYSGTTTGTFGNLNLDASTAIAGANGQTWTGSVWVQVIAGSLSGITSIALSLQQRDSGGAYLSDATNGTASAAIGATFQRITRVHTTTNASTAFVQPYLQFALINGVAIDITLRIGLPQLEQGAFATSVIPTTTAAATRAADVASITGSNFSSWYRQDEGTVFAEFAVAQPITGGNQFVFRSSDNTYNNAIALNIPGQAQLSTASGGVFDGFATSVASLVANVTAKTATAYSNNNLGISLNGATAVIDTSATIPLALTRADIGSDHAGQNRVKAGTIRRLVYWGQRLPNNVLQAITQ